MRAGGAGHAIRRNRGRRAYFSLLDRRSIRALFFFSRWTAWHGWLLQRQHDARCHRGRPIDTLSRFLKVR